MIYKNKRYAQSLKKESNKKKNAYKKRQVFFSAIVLGKREIEARQPNSAKRKCLKIQRKIDQKILYCFCPGDGAIGFVEEHDEVLIGGVGTKRGKPKGDIPAISWQVMKVNGICLKSLISKKREKKVEVAPT